MGSSEMMVKAVVWVAILGTLGGSLYFGVVAASQDSGVNVGVAIGQPSNGTSQVQVVVPMTAKVIDPPPPNFNGPIDWDTWINNHHIITDASGNVIPFRQGGYKSADISELQAGTAEFIALADVPAGQPFTYEYIPIVGEKERYLREFDGQPAAFSRLIFEPNY